MAFIAACPSQHDKLSRSNEEAISLSKEDVIEIEGIVREAMPPEREVSVSSLT